MEILAIRFQAMGDALLPLLYLARLKGAYPDLAIDYYTSSGVAELARSITGLRRVVAGDLRFRHPLEQGLRVALQWPRLARRHYDVVVDLQNNRVSRWLTRALRPARAVSFDRFSPRPAAERIVAALRLAGLDPMGRLTADPDRGDLLPAFQGGLAAEHRLDDRLAAAGWRPEALHIALNPAALLPNRQWPDRRYVQLARHLQRRLDRPVQFVFIGIERMARRAATIGRDLGADAIDLVGATSLLEAHRLLQRCDGMVTEDSALMHLAWQSGLPLVAIMGASPTYWCRPLGRRSRMFDSQGLDCAWCGAWTCPLGHTRCIDAVQVDDVVEALLSVMGKSHEPSAGLHPDARA